MAGPAVAAIAALGGEEVVAQVDRAGGVKRCGGSCAVPDREIVRELVELPLK
jgi:hypothetical protein